MYSGKVILTIDDEEAIRSSFKEFLEDCEYVVLEAENGKVGIEVFDNEKPDLVIVDLRMPKVDGVEVIKHIKRVSQLTPIIVASGTGIIDDAIEALHEGADDYILKPITDLNVLLYSIERSLERVELIKANQEYQENLESLVQERTFQLEKAVKDLESKNKLLEKEEQHLNVIFHSLNDAVVVCDKERIIQKYNPAAKNLLSYDDDALAGKTLNQLYQLYDYNSEEEIESPIYQVLNDKQRYDTQDKYILENRLHEKKIVLLSHSPIIYDRNELAGIVTVIRDISAKVKLEEDINQVQKMDAIGQLAGGVAHDFNNVLGGIIGSAEILTMKLAGNENLLNLVNIIKDAGKRAGDLTSKLLDFSRKKKIIKESFDIHKSIFKAVQILERSIDPMIDIKTNLNAKNVEIEGDSSQIENIMINLGVNARDAMPEGGDIVISSKNISFDAEFCKKSKFIINSGDYIEIIFQDSGSGMPNEVKEKIFEPFFTTKEQGKGTGLGLSSVYGTVVSHEGFITVESELNKGTAFKIYFPSTKNKKIEKEISTQDFSNLKGSNILIIDDEEIIRETSSSILQALGANVTTAESGKNAIEICKNKQFDLILLDLLMPQLNGEKTFYQIREIDEDVKFIIMSGFSEDEVVEKLLNSGASDFIQKPFNSHKLIEILTKYLIKD